MFKFRNKQEKIGIFLGCVCFFPVFILAMAIGAITNMALGMVVMLVCQGLWLTSIELCTWSLEIENRQLKQKMEQVPRTMDLRG